MAKNAHDESWPELVVRWRDLLEQNAVLHAELSETRAIVELCIVSFEEEMARTLAVALDTCARYRRSPHFSPVTN